MHKGNTTNGFHAAMKAFSVNINKPTTEPSFSGGLQNYASVFIIYHSPRGETAISVYSGIK